MSKHSPKVENIYSSTCIQALEQEYCSSCSAAVISPCLLSSRSFGERLVSRIYNGGRQAIYTATVAAMLANNMALPAYGATTYISSGKTVSGTIISAGNFQNVVFGGTARDTTINFGGSQGISDGDRYFDTIVNSGGWQDISGGSSISTTINNGGSQFIYDGGIANTIWLNNGGIQKVFSCGSTNSTIIMDGAIQMVAEGGIVTNNIVARAGAQVVSSGHIVSNTVLNSGGVQIVLRNGSAIDTTINSSGVQQVSVGGFATSTKINNGGEQKVFSKGMAEITTINNGGTQNIFSKGTASGTTINDGGIQNISLGGSAWSTIINSGGVQNIYTNDSDYWNVSNTNISGGTQNIYSGGTALYTYIDAGGVQNVFGNANDVTIRDGKQILSGGTAQDVYVVGSSVQKILSGWTLHVRVHSGARQEVLGGTAYSTFISSGGVQDVYGSASRTDISIGGIQNVSNNGIVEETQLNGGTQNISSGGLATNTTLNSGAVNLYEGGLVSGLNATGGDLNVYGNNTLQGNINLADAQVNIDHTTGMNTLGIENLSANNAVFNMNVDLETQTADKLNITDSYSGNANLKLTNVAPTAQATTGDGIKLVEFADTATVNGTFDLLGGKWDEGGYVYKLAQGTAAGTGQDYYLRNTQELTDTFKTMLNVPIMNVVIAQTGMNSLQKRLGDLRAMDNTQAKQGVWVRSYYKDMTVDDLIKTDANLFGAEAGYDWLFRAEEPTKLYAGVLVGFVSTRNIKTKKSDGAYDKGDGEAPGVGVYATLLNENGWFVDLAARNFWSKLDMKNHSATGTELAYKPNRNVVAASVEVGKSINSELARNKFIRIEPKLEIGYMHASAENASVGDTGNDIRYNAANYVNAKAGVLLAYNAVRDNGLLIEPLLELAYRYEFAGKDDLAYAGAAEKSDLSGGTLEVNAGLDMQLTKNLYWYGLGSYEASDKVKGWGVHAGIRYAFGDGKELARGKPTIKKIIKPHVQTATKVQKSTPTKQTYKTPRANYSFMEEIERRWREEK